MEEEKEGMSKDTEETQLTRLPIRHIRPLVLLAVDGDAGDVAVRGDAGDERRGEAEEGAVGDGLHGFDVEEEVNR